MDSRTSRPSDSSSDNSPGQPARDAFAPDPFARDPFANVPFERPASTASSIDSADGLGYPTRSTSLDTPYDAEFISAYDIEGEAVRARRGAADSRRRRWLEALLLLGFVLCLLVGLGALGTLYLLNREITSSYRAAPLSSLEREAVVPQLALQELTFFGGRETQTQALAYQLVSAGYGESALATATFDTRAGNLSASAASQAGSTQETSAGDTRASLLLRLARHETERGNSDRARALHTLARDLVLLDNQLPPVQRIQLLTAAATGLLSTDDVSALDTAQQAYDIATQWPNLLPAQRVQLLEGLRPVIQRLVTQSSVEDAASRLDAQLAETLRNPYLDPAGATTPLLWDARGEPLPASDAVLTARNARRAAASALVVRLQQLAAADIDFRQRVDAYAPEVAALQQALLAEDEARATEYQRLANDGATLAEQVWLLQTQRAWQVQKLKIALGGYGLSLVPQWEASVSALRDELALLTGGLRQVMEAQINAAPAEEQEALRVQTLRFLLAQSLLGFYPGASPAQIGAELDAAQRVLDPLPALLLRFDGNNEDRNAPRIFIQADAR